MLMEVELLLNKTKNKKIMILRQGEQPVPWDVLSQSVNSLLRYSENLDVQNIQSMLKKMLPTYTSRDFLVSEDKRISYSIKGEA